MVDPDLLSLFSSSRRSHFHMERFQSIIWTYYAQHRREFLWREDINPYTIAVSEIMLQQTQTDRVAKKFPNFIQQFPNFFELANAKFPQVLSLWKGLGFNRRALNLHNMASIISSVYGGELPKDIPLLEQFNGIGKATARSIFTFAFNEPSIFIETNIRTVFLYFYFNDEERRSSIHDNVLLELVEATLDRSSPREWYYALMDFGAMIKKTVGNQNHKSFHYKKQSPFEGSKRQLRGQILDILLKHSEVSREMLAKVYENSVHQIDPVIDDLIVEGLVKEQDCLLYL